MLTYWGEGKVRSLTDAPNSRSCNYRYDTRGRLTDLEEKYGSTVVHTYEAEYDTADRLKKITYQVRPDWSGTMHSARGYAWQYSSADGSLTKLIFPPNSNPIPCSTERAPGGRAFSCPKGFDNFCVSLYI